jgi:la-related protein 1
MVSSVPAPLRNSAETYAERAKKAQSSHPLNTLRVEFQATASRSSSSEAPSTSRSSASTSAFPPQIDAFSLRPRLRAPSSSGRTVDARSVDTASEAAVPSNGSRTGAQTSPTASTTLKGPPVNIWAERMKEQKAQAQLHRGEKQQQSSFMPNSPSGSSQSVSSQKASSMASSQAVTNPTVHHTSRAPVPTPGNSVAASKLATSDDHDPFVVRVPPHFSRQSSSNTNPLPVIPAVDLNGWSEVSKSPIGMQRSRDNSHSTASTSDPKGCVDDHSPNHSAVSSTKSTSSAIFSSNVDVSMASSLLVFSLQGS